MYLQESNIITLQNTCYVMFTTENCNLSHYSVCSKIFKSLFPSSGCAGREVEAQTLAPLLVLPRLPNCLRRRFWCKVGLRMAAVLHKTPTGQSTTWMPKSWVRCCLVPFCTKLGLLLCSVSVTITANGHPNPALLSLFVRGERCGWCSFSRNVQRVAGDLLTLVQAVSDQADWDAILFQVMSTKDGQDCIDDLETSGGHVGSQSHAQVAHGYRCAPKVARIDTLVSLGGPQRR